MYTIVSNFGNFTGFGSYDAAYRFASNLAPGYIWHID